MRETLRVSRPRCCKSSSIGGGLYGSGFLVAAGTLLCQSVLSGGQGQDASVQQDIQYIWPMTLWEIQLAGTDGIEGIEEPKFAETLADLALAGYKRYMDKILPKELELDPVFKAEFEKDDVSRTNRAFLRWQKRAFSMLSGMPVSELNWDGKPVPQHKEVSYEWDAFFKSKEYKIFRKRVATLTNQYLASVSKSGSNGRGKDEKVPYKTFAWAEVYPPGEYQRPHVHTGAPAAGQFVARFSNATNQRLVFEDPRGINSPFGRTHRHDHVQGELMFWPSWGSHMLTPNKGDGTNVYISCLVYPPGGAGDFDWEDDSLGDVTELRQAALQQADQKKRKSKEEL